MSQLHRRFTDDQVKVLLDGYCQGLSYFELLARVVRTKKWTRRDLNPRPSPCKEDALPD